MIEAYDENTIRCPRVGGFVNFKFCRSENHMLPCRFVVGCWHERMDINRFLEKNYSKEEMDRIFCQPKPKIESLIGMIENAKKVKEEDG